MWPKLIYSSWKPDKSQRMKEHASGCRGFIWDYSRVHWKIQCIIEDLSERISQINNYIYCVNEKSWCVVLLLCYLKSVSFIFLLFLYYYFYFKNKRNSSRKINNHISCWFVILKCSSVLHGNRCLIFNISDAMNPTNSLHQADHSYPLFYLIVSILSAFTGFFFPDLRQT